MNKLKLTRENETTIVGVRRFNAKPKAIFEAHINPEFARKWILGPEGWSMPVCEMDPRPGGKIRYMWRNDETGAEFSLTGEFISVESPNRIEHVERMHLPDPTPDNRVETVFEIDGKGTLMTIRMSLPNAETVETMLATGMAEGMENSYARLDGRVKL